MQAELTSNEGTFALHTDIRSIEDDVVVTAQGHENLNAALPKAPDELEALVSER